MFVDLAAKAESVESALQLLSVGKRDELVLSGLLDGYMVLDRLDNAAVPTRSLSPRTLENDYLRNMIHSFPHGKDYFDIRLLAREGLDMVSQDVQPDANLLDALGDYFFSLSMHIIERQDLDFAIPTKMYNSTP